MKRTDFKELKELLLDASYEKKFNYEDYYYEFIGCDETVSYDYDCFTEKQKEVLNKYF